MRLWITRPSLYVLLIAALTGCGLLPFPADMPDVASTEDITTIMLRSDDMRGMDFTIYDTLMTTLQNRLELLEITPIDTPREFGNDCLRIDIPTPADLDIVADTLTSIGLLEFVDLSMVDRASADLYEGEPIITTEQVARGLEPATGTLDPFTNNDEPFETVFTGEIIARARAYEDERMGMWAVSFELTREGGAAFGEYTGSNIMTLLGIVLDGKLLSAPTIQAPLFTGGVITGNFTEAEARQLAFQLQSGALPIALEVVGVGDMNEMDLSLCE